MLKSIESLVSFVAVNLCQVPGTVSGGKCQSVLLLQRKKNNFPLKVRLLAVPHFQLLLKSFEKLGARRSGRDRRDAPVFHGRYQ